MIVGENDYAIDFNAHIDMYNDLKDEVDIKIMTLPIDHWFRTEGEILDKTILNIKKGIEEFINKTST